MNNPLLKKLSFYSNWAFNFNFYVIMIAQSLFEAFRLDSAHKFQTFDLMNITCEKLTGQPRWC